MNKALLIVTSLFLLGVGGVPAPYVPTTRSAQTFYVLGTGSDTNPCTLALPCRQIKTAVNRFRNLRIRHLQKIEVGAGTYEGFALVGLVFDPLDGSACCVHIYGTMTNATVSPGTATGTLTSVTTGSIATATFTVFDDTSQAWAVNGLVGKFVEILTGTGAGIIHPIESNTATGISVPSTSAITATGATYAIRDHAASITTPVVYPGNLAGASGNPVQPTASNAGIYVGGILGQIASAHLRIETLKINLSGLTSIAHDVRVVSPGIGMRFDRLALVSVNTSPVNFTGPGTMTLGSSFIDRTTLVVGLVVTDGTFFLFNSYTRIAIATSVGFTTSGRGQLTISAGNRFDTGVLGTWGGPTSITFFGLTKKPIAYNNEFQLRGLASSGAGMTLLISSGSKLELLAGSTGLWLEGAQIANIEGDLTGAVTGTILDISRGARVRFGATSSITTSGLTEISLDGVASTIAAMRAASPKLVTNTYGSIVFE